MSKRTYEKWTRDEIQEYLDKNDPGFQLVSEYVNNTVKVSIICPLGHKSDVLWRGFRIKKNKCSECFKEEDLLRHKKKFEEVLKSFGYKILDHIDRRSAFVECPKGHQYKAYFSNFQKGGRCKTCFDKNRMLSLDEIKYFIENESKSGYKMVDESYEDDRKIKIQCDKGHVTDIIYGNFVSGARCIECSYLNRQLKYDFSYVKSTFESKGYKVISTEYKGVKDKLQVICQNGHEQNKSFSSLLSGYGCYTCFYEGNRGENHFNWKGGVSSLNEYLRIYLSEWKRESMRQYDFKCDVTGEDGRGQLEVHHLQPFSNIVANILKLLGLEYRENIGCYSENEKQSLLYELEKHHKENLGVPLLKDIHTQFHQTFDFHNNTPEQYFFFKNNYQEILAGNVTAEVFYMEENIERNED
ncbi:hypothetical protein ABE073_03745 [Lederbergia citrisecunda]|uniref:hypothetical protein n=1 Tax=Lederbergia citrisecunda TaxID=2833583 RepID=UPI003D29D116